MTIDEPTLMTILGLASLVASAMFLALSVFARHIPGVRYWSAGCASVGMALVLDGPRLIDDWRLASMLFNIPFNLGHALILAGTMQFCGRPRATEVLKLVSVAGIVLTVVFTFLIPDAQWRIGFLSTHQAAIDFYMAYVLWRHPDVLARRAFLVASLASIMQGAGALVQGMLVVASTQAVTYASPQVPLANIIIWTGAALYILVGNWMLFMLVMLRLLADLRAAAERDILTGLLNRRGLRLLIDGILERPREPGRAMGVMILDIDHFKVINDTHGHDMGDKVLAIMGEVLLRLEIPNTAACRWGGEEFCIVVDGADDQALVALAERVRANFQRGTAAIAVFPRGQTVSVGIASMPLDDAFEMSAVISLADAQLYRAKVAGRDQIAIATSSGAETNREMAV